MTSLVTFFDESLIIDEPECCSATVKVVKCKVGQLVRSGDTLLTFLFSHGKNDGKSSVKLFRALKPGTIVEIIVKSGDSIKNNDVIIKLEPCPHRCIMKDMCADCGENLRVKDGMPGERFITTEAKVSMIHSVPELQVTLDEAVKLGEADESNLLSQRKLVLLVDLDQTLIHTTNDEIDPNAKDIHHFQLYGPNSPWYHVRLRPNTLHFLRSISSLYELHICTFGARMYAHKIAQVLDPEKQLFGQRILSRDECFSPLLKTANLKALFPCGDRLVCIIDDRDDVWNFASNVIRVRPYKYFKHTGDINAPPGFGKEDEKSSPSSDSSEKIDEIVENPIPISTESEKESISDQEKSIIDHSGTKTMEQEDQDDYLFHLEEILRKIHTAFYQLYDQLTDIERPPETKTVVPYVRAKVLKNVNLVFSGVIPLHERLENSFLFKLANQYGATVSEHIVPLHVTNKSISPHGNVNKFVSMKDNNRNQITTHLIAARAGTSKVHMAQRMGHKIEIVNPDWLLCCTERWEKVDERLYRLKNDVKFEMSKEMSIFNEKRNPDSTLQQPDNQEVSISENEGSKKRLKMTTSEKVDTDSTSSSNSNSTENEESANSSSDEDIAAALDKEFFG